MTRPVAVIVNSDDLGISREVNDITFDLMARGRISSATILANAPATEDAARRLLRFSQCSFGVHLNLTQFAPLTGGPEARLLVDEHGRMSRANRTAPRSRALLHAAYRELCAQVDRLASLGVPITHFDSHNHVHTVPFFFPVLKALQRRYGIRRVRLTKNFYAPHKPRGDLLWRKHAYNWTLRRVFRTYTTEAFTELLTYYGAGMKAKLAVRAIELMVHPGGRTADQETAIVDSDWMTRAGLPMQLISYAQLR